jgi:hypothetical protein
VYPSSSQGASLCESAFLLPRLFYRVPSDKNGALDSGNSINALSVPGDVILQLAKADLLQNGCIVASSSREQLQKAVELRWASAAE